MKWLNSNRMTLVVVGFVATAVLGGRSTKADFTWTQKADMPTPRWNFATCSVDGKIYAIGGERSEGGAGSWRLSAMEEYDPATDIWTVKADIPTARVALSASEVTGKIYAIGGRGSGGYNSAVEEYDPAKDTWARKADMPTPRWFLSTCAVNGKIYAIGGTHQGVWSGLKTVEEYDPLTDTWTRKADMPVGVWALCAKVVNGKIYAFGGRTDLTAIPYVQEYDPATDTWTRKADMLIGTSQMASAVFGDKVIVIGGWYWSMNFPYTTVQMYDPETNLWTREADAPFLRAAVSASAANNRIYVIGGTDRPHPCPAFSTVYEFGPLIDFNGDGIVDAEDMCIIIDHWGTDEPLCDIGPMPWGDGIVDVEDLKVLAEHLFEEIPPTEPIE